MDSRTIEQKREYLQEIAHRTPPQGDRDELLCKVYKGLLRDIEWFLIFGGSRLAEVPELIHDGKHLD